MRISRVECNSGCVEVLIKLELSQLVALPSLILFSRVKTVTSCSMDSTTTCTLHS